MQDRSRSVGHRGKEVRIVTEPRDRLIVALDLPDVDALKVAHHGSADAGLPDLLHRLAPRVAVIEVGAGNPYGHPAPSTLKALRSALPAVFRTDRDGEVTVTLGPGGLSARARSPGSALP